MKISVFNTLIVLAIMNQIAAQTGCKINSLNFQPGEELHYTVSYNWFLIWTEVGEISCSVSKAFLKNKPCYHLLGTGRTYPGWDIFFKVRDRYESWVHPESLKPVYFKRRVREGGFEIDIRYLFNRERNHVLSSYIVNRKPEEKDTLQITGCTFDIMSVLYYARTLDYSAFIPEQVVPVIILLDRQLEHVYFRYKGIEKIKIRKLGEFECIKLSVMLVSGSVFKGGENMTVWITNDKNKIPLYVETPIIVGSVKARLISFDKLMYPLNPDIK